MIEMKKKDKIPLDDILSVLISVPGCSVSTVVIDELCKRNIPLVISGSNFLPSSMVLPVSGYGRQFHVMCAQSTISKPRRKKAWQKIIKAKILNQANALLYFGNRNKRLEKLSIKVKSGDSDNYEAQAAKIYWREMFGSHFRRDQDAPGINAALNYSYAVLRGCVARGLCGAGLHPTFSVHHKGPQNPLNLADDFIEPFRPFADMRIKEMMMTEFETIDELTPAVKTKLAAITNMLVLLEKEHSPVSLACVKTARSFASYVMKETDHFSLPEIPKNLSFQSDEKTKYSESL